MADRDKDAEKAIRLYEESLKYFNPLVYYESDMKKKEKLRSTVSGMCLNYLKNLGFSQIYLLKLMQRSLTRLTSY